MESEDQAQINRAGAPRPRGLPGVGLRGSRQPEERRCRDPIRAAGNRLSCAGLRRFAETRDSDLCHGPRRNRACNPSHSTRFRWHLSPRPSSRPRPPTRVCARVGAHAGRCPIRRERERAGGADVDCSSGESRAEATVGLICRQHRRSRRTDQGRPSICPALSSERRSGQRSAITRAGDRVAAMRKYTFGRRRQISGGGVR